MALSIGAMLFLIVMMALSISAEIRFGSTTNGRELQMLQATAELGYTARDCGLSREWVHQQIEHAWKTAHSHAPISSQQSAVSNQYESLR